MRQAGIRGAKRRRKPWRTTVADPEAHKRPDLVNREFTADRPDRLWVGDLERHEALWNREEVRDLFRRPVAAGR